ncbi:unnamed protein product [Linum tenue]|uniref:Agglutinin domain-containing protein n=1 Tax=Linum tenue TaxID=586396 RepID=A0AAV0RM67_9ROSI|nr:unnamed protein product [Linum tenue]
MAAPALELPLGLPRTVVLKSKYNGEYIRYTNEEITFQRYLQATADAAASPLAKFHVEASKTSTDLVHIRCAYSNKYWAAASRGNPWIAAAADGPEEDQSNWSCTLFEPVVLAESDNRVFRLRHVQLNRYATLFDNSASPLHNFVQAVSEHPDLAFLMDAYEVVDRESLVVLPQLAAFKGGDGLYMQPSGGTLIFYGKDIGDEYVEELVIKREIYDVAFRVPDARIYDENIIVAATGHVRNEGPNLLNQKLTIKYTDTKSHMWQGNVTLKLGVKITVKTGIPMLVAGGIEISADASRSTTWGDTETSSTEVTSEYDAVVSPHTLMTVNVVATRGVCDVPFSYTQRDLRLDGITVVTYPDDGLFTGVNSFNYYYDTKEEPLPPPPSASTTSD